MCIVYKCRNGLVLQYLAGTYSNMSDNHTRTETHQNLNIVKPKTIN